MYVFRHLSQLQDRPQKLQDRIFKRLFEAAEIAKFSPAERQAYEESLKYYRDLKNVVDTSKEEGIEEGIERGIQQGLEKGIEQGMIKVAKEMKQDGEAIDKIIRYTGLSKKQIEQL